MSVVTVTRPSQFIRLCRKIVEEQQFRDFRDRIGGRKGGKVILDMQSANAMVRCYDTVDFRLKKKLMRLIVKRGAITTTVLVNGLGG